MPWTPFSFAILVAVLHATGVLSESVVVRTDLPNIKYIFEGQYARLECCIIKEDGTTEEPSNSIWIRSFSNKTIHQFTTSDSVRVAVHRNTLVFWPSVINSDQGQYYCCIPNRQCSEHVNITLFAAPVINAVIVNYTAFLGSHITLSCKIIYWGKPKATIYWKTPQEEFLSNDLVQTNDTHTTLLLNNLTEQDNGRYLCIANATFRLYGRQMLLYLQVPPKIAIDGLMIAHIGEIVNIICTVLEGRPSPDVHISSPLGEITEKHEITFSAKAQHTGKYTCTANISTQIVTEDHYLYVYDINNVTSHLQFLAIIHNSDCHFKYGRVLSAILKNNVYEICKCNVNISTERFECISDRRALYYVTVTGFMAGNIKEILTNEELAIEIGSETATLHICDTPCEEVTDITDQDDHHNNNHHGDNRIAIWMALSAVVILLVVIISFVIYKLLNGVNECVPRKETSADHTPNPLARDPVTTFQQLHLTKETIPEENIRVPASKDVVVASSNSETLSSIQPNDTITTVPKQSTLQRNRCYTQVDRNNGLEILKYEAMVQRVTRDFASSTGTDV